MRVDLRSLIASARSGGYAVGAFNIYNLEGALAVAEAAERLKSPAILQIHPSALDYGGPGLVSLARTIANDAAVPIAVHLDHAEDFAVIERQIAAGVDSVMADGSHLGFEENLEFTRRVVELAHGAGLAVEAELGRLSGTEDDLSVGDLEARLTDPDEAVDFVARTHVDTLAVCIGNVHGPSPTPPDLDFPRLHRLAQRIGIPLVLHGASGLDGSVIREAITLGVAKFNVNTEVRAAGVDALGEALKAVQRPDLLPLLRKMRSAMISVIAEKLIAFGSEGRVTP